MSTILKILLIIVLFIGFFEAGLLSSYTIITSESPDIQGLIDLQVETISSLFSPENINSILIKDPDVLNVTNPVEVAEELTNLTNVDGVNIDFMNATTYESGDSLKVKVHALAYSPANATKGQIVLSGTPDYKIVASADAVKVGNGVKIDVKTLKVVSIFQLYDSK